MGKQEDHNAGEKAGSQAGLFDEVVERTNPFSSPEYKEGFDNGLRNRPQKKDSD
jgi:hypothetical protein